MKTNSILLMVIRIAGSIQLLSGIVFWTGNAKTLVIGHILLGSILTIALFMVTYRAYRNEVSLWLVIIAAAWSLGLPIWGLAQERILPGSYHWISQVLHVLCGVGIIGVAEMLGAKMLKKSI
jgi:hypothetical protein